MEKYSINYENLMKVVNKARILEHQRNYHTWYLYPNGSISGPFEFISKNEDIMDCYNNDCIVILQVGTA